MPPPNLKRTLTFALVVVATFAAASSVSLMVFTNQMHRTTTRLNDAVESVRLAEEAQRDLLLHQRARDPVLRDEIAAELRRRLAEAHGVVTTPRERELLTRANLAVDEYLRPYDEEPGTPTLALRDQTAYAALTALIRINLAQASAAHAGAMKWDRVANIVAGIVAVVVLAGTAATVVWLQTRAFRPLYGLAAAMGRFRRGDEEARAVEQGPAELREMASRFNEMARAIARQRKARFTFLAAVAHDLRTPLSALRLSTDLVRPDAPLPPEPKLRHLLGVVRRQVARLDRLVSDFLDAATVESGKLELRVARHDARDLVNDVAQLFEDTSEAHRIVLEVPDEPIDIACDAVRVEQVLGNLVSNAIKYSPDGGRVAMEVEARGDEVVFSVSDEGIGMTDEDISAAFEPFHRSGGLRDEVPGTGLGLHVVMRIVEAHGGKVEVKSEPGRGSTFIVRLPAPGRSSKAERRPSLTPRLSP